MTDQYENYDAWKGWDETGFMVTTDFERAYYDVEFADIPVAGQRVLEIGFGSGSLLAWLRGKDAELYGTELSPQGRKLAADKGVHVLDATLTQLEELEGTFGVVAAFDVLEHLTYQEIVQLLDTAGKLLRPGGYFVARFPNGASPLGRFIQHGDITHVTTLTASKLSQLMLGKPFVMQRAGDTAVPKVGGLAVRMGKHVRSVLRSGLERTLKALYALHDVPFYYNMTVVLRRVGADEAGR